MSTALVRETASAEQTEALAAELARRLKAGDVVLLDGELGAGKTTFVRGLARALGVEQTVNSPTFTIGHRYHGERVDISHLDLYRVGALENEDPELLSDYLGGEQIAVIEWAAPAREHLPPPRFEITISHLGHDSRRIEIIER